MANGLACQIFCFLSKCLYIIIYAVEHYYFELGCHEDSAILD